jgi:predicted PurR-regulated permease PerM
VNNLPHYFDALKNTAVWFRDRLAFLSLSPETTSGMVEAVEGTLTTSAGSIFETIKNFFGSLARFVIMIAITFYILIEEDSVKGFFRVAVPRDKQEFLTRLFVKIQTQIGSWLKGQLILSFIVSCFIFIILTILNVKYALVIALIAFAGEFFPYVGPLITAIPAVLLALIDSPVKAVLVIISFIVMQQIENHIIVPQVMKKAIGLNPLISIFALYIGARLAGVLGVVIALPAAATLIVTLEQIYLPAGETRNN